MAAPASAAATAASAICFGVTGKFGDIDGVWIEPVMAQVMMTLRRSAMVVLLIRSSTMRACVAVAQAGGGRAHGYGAGARPRSTVRRATSLPARLAPLPTRSAAADSQQAGG